MPKTKISEFSATAGNNTDIDGINISEGCPPSGINDAIRELMAQLKDFQAGTAGDSFNGPVGTTTPAAGAFTNFSASGTFALTGDQVQISEGGTGQTTANAAFNALAPSQTSNSGKYLKTDGTNTSWDAIDINTADITGTLPIANGGTGLTALGTGVQTALGIAVGSAGAFVTNGGALGTPSSGTVTNLTGTASININGTVGATTPTTGAFTTLSASGNITVSGGTANGVAYLNGSKVLTTGGALTFDGTNFVVGGTYSAGYKLQSYAASGNQGISIVNGGNAGGDFAALSFIQGGTNTASIYTNGNNLTVNANTGAAAFQIGASEQMRLTSTGLGIGTSTIVSKLAIGGYSSANIAPDIQITRSSSGTVVQSGPNITFNDGTTNNTVTLQNTQGRFGVWNYGAGVWNERMSIDSAGNVGIGTSSPASKLSVAGAARLTADVASVSLYTGEGWRHTGSSGLYIDANFGGAANSVFIRNGSGLATQLTLDSSGDLGLGVTPSAWSGGYLGFQVKDAAFASFTSGYTWVGNNWYNNSGNKYIANGFATLYQQNSGAHSWYTAANNSSGAGAALSFTQAMTLTQGGNLLLGTTTSSGARIDSQGSVAGVLEVFNGSNTSLDVAAITRLTLASQGGNWYIENQRIGAPLCFNSNGTERARITLGGDLCVGTTGAVNSAKGTVTQSANATVITAQNTSSSITAGTGGIYVTYANASPNGTGASAYKFDDSTATRFEVRSNGGIANYQANDVNLSDRREKTNFAPAKSYLDTICAIPVQTFNYIDQSEDDPGLTLGVVAQDVQAVAPELVMESNWGTEDNPKMRLSIYQTDLQYALMKCIQELKAQNDDLRARVAQLEAK